MKKLIAVMAFAGVLSVPSVLLADANWYGSLRGGVEFGGGKDARFADGGSRWGIKGSNEVSEGLSAVYRFEAKIDSASATQVGGDRLSYVGLSGGFGTLALGRVGSAGGNSTGGILDNSFHYGNSYTGFRTGNAISYSHSVSGVSVQLDAIMNPKIDSGNAIDETQLGLSLNLGDFGKLAVSHVNVEDSMESMTADLRTSSHDGNVTIDLNDDDGIVFQEGNVTDGYVDADIEWRTADGMIVDKDAVSGIMHKMGTTPVMAMVVYKHADDTLDATAANSMLKMVGDKLYSSSCVDADDKLVELCDGKESDDNAEDTAVATAVWVKTGSAEEEGKATTKTYSVAALQRAEITHSATTTLTAVTPGEKKSTIAAEFGLGGITAFLGYSQVESKMQGAKKDKITHYGIRGGLGDSGVNFLVQARSEDLQGSAPKDADRNPYVVNMSKSLGDGATAYIEHGTSDAKDAKANTRIGMIVNF